VPGPVARPARGGRRLLLPDVRDLVARRSQRLGSLCVDFDHLDVRRPELRRADNDSRKQPAALAFAPRDAALGEPATSANDQAAVLERAHSVAT